MFKINFKLIVCSLMLVFLASEFSYVQASGSALNIVKTKSRSGNNSSVISSNAPYKLSPGQEYTVTITMLNSGDNEWNKNENFYLKLFNGADNQFQSDVWSINRVELPQDVYPADKVTFLFKITAPKTNGAYNMQWAMAKDYDFFGEYTSNIINVEGEFITPVLTDNENNSEFVSSSVPEIMTAGEKYKVSVTMKNTGKTEWSPASYNDYKISPLIESSDITYLQWNSESSYLSNTVYPGQTINIEFYVTAPSSPGIYHLQWIMKKGDNTFGQRSNKVSVNVPGSNVRYTDTKAFNASFMEQSVPIIMTYNEIQDISVTLINTGDNTWIQGREQLVMIDSKMSLVTLNSWNVGYIQLPNNVEPGRSVTFNFKVRPSETGWMYFQCRMMRGDETLFGSPSQSVEVLVSKK